MSGFRRSREALVDATIMVDGEPVPAVEGESVASALIAAGRAGFAVSGKTGHRLAPYCLIGACFGCLCEIDGRPQVQACLEPVRTGMVVHTRNPEPPHDR